MLIPSDPRTIWSDIKRNAGLAWGAVGGKSKKSRSIRNFQRSPEFLRSIGKDNPITLEVIYSVTDITLSAGVYASTSFFMPGNFPGWEELKSLFREWKLQMARVGFIPYMGTDENGLFSARYTPDPSATIESSVNNELLQGAVQQPLSKSAAFEIDMHPRTFESMEFHTIDGTTEFGDAKEYGQVFLRFDAKAGSSTNIGLLYFRSRITLRGYIG